MRAFILTDNDGQIRDRDMLDLYDGFLELSVPIQFYTQSDMYINKYAITKDDIVVGHVNMSRAALNHLKLKEPIVYSYPLSLDPFLHRKIWMLPIDVVEGFLKKGPHFVKPIKAKVFTAFVCHSEQQLYKTVEASAIVYISEVVKFENEHRVYVYNKKIVDVFRYWGDNWKDHINGDEVEKMVATLASHEMPIFYSVDVGLIFDGDESKTALVEVNDGYALGNYGLGAKQYAEMSMKRWQQIVGV